MRTTHLVVALACAGAAATGCSSSNGVGPADGAVDSHTSSSYSGVSISSSVIITPSGSSTMNQSFQSTSSSSYSYTPPPDAGHDAGRDAPGPLDSGHDSGKKHDSGVDAGQCNFATFVIGLITTDTNGHALPSTNLGQTCVDDMKQSDFASLFP